MKLPDLEPIGIEPERNNDGAALTPCRSEDIVLGKLVQFISSHSVELSVRKRQFNQGDQMRWDEIYADLAEKGVLPHPEELGRFLSLFGIRSSVDFSVSGTVDNTRFA